MNFGLLHVSNPAKACAEACRVEPDFLPVSVAEPQEVRAFWDGWLA
jgi:hypothetical protein